MLRAGKKEAVGLLLLFFSRFVLADGLPAFSLTGLEGWQAQTFKKKAETAYALEDGVLRADCKASASGLVWKQAVDVKKTPWLSWRWKVEAPLQGNDETAKRGDDFIARVYAVHDGGWALWRTRSVVYVWSNGLSAAESFPNAYTRQAHIVPLQRGAAEGWKRERRNLREDLKKYFGDDLDRIDAIALMSDCDDTGQSGRAWYGDIRLTAD